MSRPQGVIETTQRQAKPPAPNHTYHTHTIELLHSETESKWIVFNSTVYCIGDMYPSDYLKFVQSFASNQFMADILLDGIDEWDDWARWYTCLELVKRKKITLYNSRAERAMEVPTC